MSIKAMLTRPAGIAQYTVGEEIANAVTHGVAALLSIAGLAVLVAFAVLYSGSPKVVAARAWCFSTPPRPCITPFPIPEPKRFCSIWITP